MKLVLTVLAMCLCLPVVGADKDKPKFDPKKPFTFSKSYQKELIRKAEAGDAKTQFNLGHMFSTGRGMEKDVKEAEKWYRKAAEQGHAAAQHNLGMAAYLRADFKVEGEEVFVPGVAGAKEAAARGAAAKEAVMWYHKAAEQGYAASQSELGYMYRNGYGVRKSGKEAVKWYRKAAEQGEAIAANFLGDMYKEGDLGLLQDEEEAVTWYLKAIEAWTETAMKGDAHSQYKLGGMYCLGRGGLGRDFVTAYAWYNIAAYFEHAAAKLERDILITKVSSSQISRAQKLSRQLLAKIEGKVTGNPPVDYEKMPAPRIDPKTGLPIAKWFKLEK